MSPAPGSQPGVSPGFSTHTDSEAPWVKGVPGKVSHCCTVLDGGHSCIRLTARLGELWKIVGKGHCTAPNSTLLATVLCLEYLEDSDLATSREQGQGDALVVGTEAIALARCGEAEPSQVGEVGVAVQYPSLCMPEAGTGAWHRQGTHECPGCPPLAEGHQANLFSCSPKMFCSDFWLGLLAKPLEGPVLAEREVVALLGDASEDGEE